VKIPEFEDLLEKFLHGRAKAGTSLFDLFGGSKSVTHSELMLSSIFQGIEGLSLYESDFLFDGLVEKCVHGDIRCGKPVEKTTFRGDIRDLVFGKIGPKSLFHGIPFFAVMGDDFGKKGIKIAPSAVFVYQGLGNHAGAYIRTLLEDRHFPDNIFGPHTPGDSRSRGEDFGETSRIDGSLVLIQGIERGKMIAVEAYESVGIVFENGNAVLLGYFEKSFAALQRKSAPQGVVKVYDTVYVTDLSAFLEGSFDELRQIFHQHSLFVTAHGKKMGSMIVHVESGSEKGGVFNDNGVIFVDGGPVEKIYYLGGASGDKKFFHFWSSSEARSKPGSEKLLERSVSFGGAVLKHITPLFFEDASTLVEFLYREDGGIRHSPGKRNHAGLADDVKHFSNGRGL